MLLFCFLVSFFIILLSSIFSDLFGFSELFLIILSLGFLSRVFSLFFDKLLRSILLVSKVHEDNEIKKKKNDTNF